MKELRYVIGRTVDGEILIANLGRYEDKRLSISFDTVEPFVWDGANIDHANYILDGFSDDRVLQYLIDNDCKYSEIAEHLLQDIDIEDVYDISLCPENFGNIYFESISWGQHDVPANDIIFKTELQKCAYSVLYQTWKSKQLQVVDDKEYSTLVENMSMVFEQVGESSQLESLALEILG